jgi:GNAT superfamily N-acetyltransferase
MSKHLQPVVLGGSLALSFRLATDADVSELLKLRLAVDKDQAQRFGENRWSTSISKKSVARWIRSSRILVAQRRGQIIAAVRMETKKPWAVDLQYFTPVAKAVYLHDVNVDPQVQRLGIGRRLIERAKGFARRWPVDAMRLDAYDGPAGAGPFYEKCGFKKVGRTVYRGVPLVYFELLLL